MSHNYTGFGSFSKLTVRNDDHSHGPDNDGTVTFQFGGLVNSQCLFVVVGDELRAVEGEDLYALRELLTSDMKPEHFVRPADPVEVPRWVDGDKVFCQEDTGHAWVYLRRDGFWQAIGVGVGSTGIPSQDGSPNVSDAVIDEYLSRYSTFSILRQVNG